MGKFNIFYYLMQMSQYPLCWLLCMKGPSCFTIISVGTLGQRSLRYSSSATGLCSSWKALWKNHCPQNIHNDWCTCWSPAGRGGNACQSFTKQQGSRSAQLLARVSRAAWFGAASPLHPFGSTNQC